MKTPIRLLEQALTARVDAIHGSQRRWREGDADALHDLRVAVRRLRTSLAPWRGHSELFRLQAPLRKLARAMADSGALRDHEVYRQWLPRLVPRPDARLLSWWSRPAPPAEVIASPRHRLVPLIRQLARELTPAWRQAVRAHGASALLAERDVLARRLLFRIQSALGDETALMHLPESLHALRLDCKRLRYLLEPTGAPAVKVLRRAQHALGDWRDVDSLLTALRQDEVLSVAAARRITVAHTGLLQAGVNALQDLGKLTEADLS